MHKNSENTDRKTDKIERRTHLNCSICPPNRGENASRTPKHGVKKPKKKDHRK